MQNKPSLGVCYYPEHWPRQMWEDDASRMVETGISVVRIAEFAWSRMEPTRGDFDFAWLDEAIDILVSAGLKVVMCTPTATPPKWLVDEMPDMLAITQSGDSRGFGSRRHYCFSHQGYRIECARITEMLAKRYGAKDGIIAWQTDNEFGCHNTTISFSKAAKEGFQNWLAQKYQSPQALNRAWGNVFWSMEITDFSQIELPNQTVTEANPAHWLDFRRYTSDQVVAFNKLQADIIRKHSPGRDIIHNFMGRYLEFDHFGVSADLDIASWDSYPIGFLEQFGRDNAWKNWYMRAGDPDFQAFHHDLYRSCGAQRAGEHSSNGRWWVMEQQPGPVNWAPFNPDPHPGMVRLWSHEAFAHGAEVVSYFRWRQAPFAQEQMHTGLNRPDNSPDRALEEACKVGLEIQQLPSVEKTQSKVALIFDYQSLWATQTQPQGATYDSFDLVFGIYSSLRQLGQSIDIVRPGQSLDGYEFVVAPNLLFIEKDTIAEIERHKPTCLFGPRTGSRTSEHQTPENLAPGALQSLLPMKVERVESLRPGYSIPVSSDGGFQRWFEHVCPSSGTEVVLETKDAQPALMRNNNLYYLAGWPDESLLKSVLQNLLEASGLPVLETGDDLRIRDNGQLRTIVNYGPKPRSARHLISSGDDVLIGDEELPIAGVAILQRSTKQD